MYNIYGYGAAGYMANHMSNKQLNDNAAHAHTLGTLTSILRKEADSVSQITSICMKASEIATEMLLAMAVSGIMINVTHAGQNTNAKEKHSSQYTKNATSSNMLAVVEVKPKESPYQLGANDVPVKNTERKSHYVLRYRLAVYWTYDSPCTQPHHIRKYCTYP